MENEKKQVSSNKGPEIVSKDKLLEAGVYFGHKKTTWNPKMKPYIAKVQKGTHIIDIDKTKKILEFAYSLIKSFAEKGASFIFVGTKKQAKATIKENALRTNSYYVSERWLGGTLTNSRTIFARVKRMEELENLQANNYEGYTKKEGLLFDRELYKLQKNLQGIRTMRRKPNVMIIADPSKDLIAVKEAKRLGIKTIGIVDTNNDPSVLDVAIPANDDSVKSITLIITILADAIAKGKGGAQLFAFQDDSAIVLPQDQKRPRKEFTKRRTSNFVPRKRFENRSEFKKEVTEKKAEIKTETKEVKTETNDLQSLKVADLRAMAKDKKIKGYSTMKKDELIQALN